MNQRNGTPRRARRQPMAILLLLLLQAAVSLVSAPRPGHAAEQPFVGDARSRPAQPSGAFEGVVFEGDAGAEIRPLAGVTVALYGANDAYPAEGHLIASAITDSQGWYRLEFGETAEFYSIRESNLPGYYSVGAASPGGTPRDDDWIEYTYPLEGKDLTGNIFWDQPQVTLPPQVPDLVVGPYDWFWGDDGYSLVFSVQIANAGPSWAPGSQIFVGAVVGNWPGQYAPVPEIEAGQSTQVRVRLPVPPAECGQTRSFRITADATNQVQELDERNNEVTTAGILIRCEPAPGPAPRGGGQERAPDLTPLILGAVGLVVLVVASLAIRQAIRRRARPKRPPAGPILPPVRLLRAWLSEGSSGQGRVLAPGDPLVVGASYSLHLQIPPGGGEATGGQVPLRAVLFAPETDFALARRIVPLELPWPAAAISTHRPIVPQQAGRRRLRLCLYLGNVLVQSALLEATVAPAGARGGPGAPPTTYAVDYVASASLAGLENLPQPALSIFTNQAPDGSHWIGVYSAGAAARTLRIGEPRTFAPGTLDTMAQAMRKQLATIQGEGHYALAQLAQLPRPDQIASLETFLVKLARAGWTAYDQLFCSAPDAAERAERWQALQAVLKTPGVISIARCREESATIPWAALYDLALDPEGQLTLCPIFKAQLLEKRDLLDDPLRCRSDPNCPLQDPNCWTIVCPFGWWGFKHQVEQPLQQVHPAGVDQVPADLQGISFEQTSRLEYSGSPQVAIAADPNLGAPTRQHEQDLAALVAAAHVGLVCEEDREKVMQILAQGGRQLYYFFCHGEVQEQVFMLRLGPAGHPGYISAAALLPQRIQWGSQRPFIVLNACETIALLPERLDGLMYKFRFLGASGVMGTEIKVWTNLAQPFGLQLLQRLLQGQSLGEAFLSLRREMLRTGNPLGLVYSFYAPATLHLHDRSGCPWCQAHPPRREGAG